MGILDRLRSVFSDLHKEEHWELRRRSTGEMLYWGIEKMYMEHAIRYGEFRDDPDVEIVEYLNGEEVRSYRPKPSGE